MAAVSPEIARKIRIGIAGWSYPDWEGFVYPPGTRDKLRFVAEYIDLVEINTTFYRPPERSMVASWARRTRDLPGFAFTAKLNREVTHDQRIDPAMVAAFRDGLAPLAEDGRLQHLLAQFRWNFEDTPHHRAHLEQIRKHFGGIAGNLALEVRHRSWQSPEALDFLSGLEVTVANLDYPLARDSFDMRLCPVGNHAYLRLHGRNAAAWFDRKAGRDQTYNYCYEEEELDDIAERAVSLAGMSKSLVLVANNHYQGKEMLNAIELKARVMGGPVFAPPDLVKNYPRIRKIARPRHDGHEQPELF